MTAATSTPTTAVQMHRLRSVEWTPSGIVALASVVSSPVHSISYALARENGNIELYTSTLALHRTIVGSRSLGLHTLIWTPNGTLIAGTKSGVLLVVNLAACCLDESIDSYGGAIWSLAVLDNKKEDPQDEMTNEMTDAITPSKTDTLLVGCEDGKIRLYDVTDGLLVYRRRFTGSTARVVSLTTHENHVFSGHDDGMICKWDAPTGHCVSRMTLANFKVERTIVWSLDVSPDGQTLAAGDSMGAVTLWDTSTCTLRQTFNQLTADVTCVCFAPTGKSLFATGLDAQVILIGQTPTVDVWTFAYSHRSHTHDVRALCCTDTTLLSGGTDTQLVSYPVAAFTTSRPVKQSPYPIHSVLSVAPLSRLLTVVRDSSVDLYRIPRTDDHGPASSAPLVCRVTVSGPVNLRTAALSHDGSLLVTVSPLCVKLFRLSPSALLPTKVPASSLEATLSSPSSSVLVLAMDPTNHYFLTGSADGSLRCYDQTTLRCVATTNVGSGIASLTLDPTGTSVAVVTMAQSLLVLSLATLTPVGPPLAQSDALVICCSFHADGVTLSAVSPDALLTYDTTRGALLSRLNTVTKKSSLSGGLVLPAGLQALLVVPDQSNQVLLQGINVMVSVNLDTHHVKTIDTYRPMVCCSFLAAREMVVVEMPWLKVLTTLPPPLYRRQYGKN